MRGGAIKRGIVVVTGASGRIGAAICSALGEDGYVVLAQYNSHGERAMQLKAVLEAQRVPCRLVRADLMTEEGIRKLINGVEGLLHEDASAQLRALVNNAALLLSPAFDKTTASDFDEYVSLNLKAPFFLSQRLARSMQSGASIVNISSASAHIASAGDIVYAMTKSGLESLTRNMAVSLAPRGIRVNAVVPGFTDNGHALFANDAARTYMGNLSVLGGVASPHNVADAVRFLVSNRASRTTGAFLDVTGGMLLHPRPHDAGSVRESI